MTDAEREEALHQANEKMKAYYTNRPPIEVIQESKRRSQKRDQEHYIQALIGMFLLLSMSLSCLNFQNYQLNLGPSTVLLENSL